MIKGQKHTIKCLNCNKEFVVPEYRYKQNPKFCGYDCYWESKKKPNPIQSEKLKEYYKKNKGYWTGKKRGKTPFEVRKKLSEANRGERAYQWKGGVSKVYENIRKTEIYIEWRNKVFERDGYVCQLCGAKSSKGCVVKVNAHHKKTVKDIISQYNIQTKWDSYQCKELWDINNGITLCESCHRLVHKRK